MARRVHHRTATGILVAGLATTLAACGGATGTTGADASSTTCRPSS